MSGGYPPLMKNLALQYYDFFLIKKRLPFNFNKNPILTTPSVYFI